MRVVTSTDQEIPYLHYEPQKHYTQEIPGLSAEDVDEASVEPLEHRYYYERLLLQEVAQGSQDLALKCYRQFSQESRSIVHTEGPLCTVKNLGFSLNTMLRKSAETTGIHPVYLGIVSSNFVMLIENANNIWEAEECKSQVISTYYRFIRRDRLDWCSPLARKAVTCIHTHLAGRFTLAGVAKGIRIGPSCLSRLFNRETRDSVSNFITRARMEKAAGLLSFSGMSIQNIAFYVRFGDLNYFSGCFGKYKKMTPTEYRASSSIGV